MTPEEAAFRAGFDYGDEYRQDMDGRGSAVVRVEEAWEAYQRAKPGPIAEMFERLAHGGGIFVEPGD
jgi:hypothetical protein